MGQLILIAFLVFAAWAIRQDTATRNGISAATWIPTLWLGIIASRPVSFWFGTGGGINTLDGSPIDRLFYLSMIVAATVVVLRRGLDWPFIIQSSWQIFFFYGFLLLSVLWANSIEASSKRWIKEFGNILVVLVILSEKNPLQAIRSVFVRCAIVLIPLSVIFLRYFPDLGRRYLRSGDLEVIGVTTQKNSLGVMVLVCCLVLLWDWLERTRNPQLRMPRWQRLLYPAIFAFGCWLLYLCDSKTSILCFGLGVVILSSVRIPILRERINQLGKYVIFGGLAFYLVEWKFGISGAVLSMLGRDATFTGRTEVWAVLGAIGTDPLLGTGFMSFWDDPYFQERLPEWVAFSAHNGYLEVYLAGGYLGITALTVMLAVTTFKLLSALKDQSSYSAFRFAVLVVTLLGNFSESNFGGMSPLGFLFLLAAIGHTRAAHQARAEFEPETTDYEPGPRSALQAK